MKVLQTNDCAPSSSPSTGDALTESDVKGKNPFRTNGREALYRAIDIDALQRAMRGLPRNTGALVAPRFRLRRLRQAPAL